MISFLPEPTVTAAEATTGIAPVAAIAIVALLVLLGVKELFSEDDRPRLDRLLELLGARELPSKDETPRFHRLSRHVNMAILPLLLVFAFIVVMKVAQSF